MMLLKKVLYFRSHTCIVEFNQMSQNLSWSSPSSITKSSPPALFLPVYLTRGDLPTHPPPPPKTNTETKTQFGKLSYYQRSDKRVIFVDQKNMQLNPNEIGDTQMGQRCSISQLSEDLCHFNKKLLLPDFGDFRLCNYDSTTA